MNAFNDAMKRATDESIWKGAARNAVAKAVGDYSSQAVQLANAAKLTGSKVTELETGLNRPRHWCRTLLTSAPMSRTPGIGARAVAGSAVAP
ncbi:hypothetical protein ACQP2U_13115 [Nocardia sp. CA-084685]|uniref:hypothetical protein n=1 Tax=Nocardia sp. CA-084685 TaxID=3239970 RepID=UPI003D986F5F